MKNWHFKWKVFGTLYLNTLFSWIILFSAIFLFTTKKIKKNIFLGTDFSGSEQLKTLTFVHKLKWELSLKAKGLISLMFPISWFRFNVCCVSTLRVGEKHRKWKGRIKRMLLFSFSPGNLSCSSFKETFLFETNGVSFDIDSTTFGVVEKGSKSKVYKMLRTSGIFYWRHKKLIMPLWSESLFPVPEMFQYVFIKWEYFTQAFLFPLF